MLSAMSAATPLSGLSPDRIPLHQDPRGYRLARDVQIAAAATRPNYTQQIEQAIQQLGKTLESGVPLRRDVPRGFHLNIVA
ncbi:MAG: hypothetical protein EA405_04475 [Rhodospirillales bacterium]|nr:MAG: hypothetical protein EA405_04475 [Rhodospirillales bacterium]